MNKKIMGFILSTFWMFSSSAYAEQNDLLNLLKVLNENGTITTAQYEKLKSGIETQKTDPVEQEEEKIQVKTKGGIEISTYDGQFSFKLGGRLMLDGALYDEDKNSLGDGTELRRARIDVEGILFADWGYEFGIDFAGGDADVKDAVLSYDALWPAKIQIGQFKEPFSLEEMTSSKYITFMERSLPNEFAPVRSLGIGARTYGDMWTAAAGIFGEGFDDDADDEGDEGWGITGRGSFSPVHSDRSAVHLGASASFRKLNDEKEVKINQRPESHVTDIKYVDTGKIPDTDNLSKYGLEIAGVFGPFSLQGEYIYTDVSREEGAGDLSFDGWYAYGSWFLTGETRPYKVKKGTFGRIKPRSKYGAIELAARYSMIDLNDGAIKGGKEENITLGVNWYLNPNTRLMANYIFIDNDDDADADGDLIGNDDPQIFQTRIQLDF